MKHAFIALWRWLAALFRGLVSRFRRAEAAPKSGWGRRTKGNARLVHFFAILDGEAKPKCGRVTSFPADELKLVPQEGEPRCGRCA